MNSFKKGQKVRHKIVPFVMEAVEVSVLGALGAQTTIHSGAVQENTLVLCKYTNKQRKLVQKSFRISELEPA